MQIRRNESMEAEIPMGPLIDVVFLLLIFFLVTAKPIQPESDVGLQLPGTVAQEQVLEIPDEQRITIRPDGQLLLNEAPVDSPGSRDLPQLVTALTRFKEMADANRSEAMITLDAEDGVKHQRIVDALNACALAGIKGVTFATESEAGEAGF